MTVMEDVRRLEEARWAALIKGDLPALERLVADEMAYTHSNGIVQDKAAFFAQVVGGTVAYRGIARSDERACVVGETVALLGRATIESVANGTSSFVHVCYTSVWARRNGQWRFVCWQSTRLGEPNTGQRHPERV